MMIPPNVSVLTFLLTQTKAFFLKITSMSGGSSQLNYSETSNPGPSRNHEFGHFSEGQRVRSF